MSRDNLPSLAGAETTKPDTTRRNPEVCPGGGSTYLDVSTTYRSPGTQEADIWHEQSEILRAGLS